MVLLIIQLEIQNQTPIFLDSWFQLFIWLSISLGLLSFLIDFFYSIIYSGGPVFSKNWRNTSKKCNLDNQNMDIHHRVDKGTVMEMSLNHLDHLHEDELELVKGCLNDQKDLNEKGQDGMTALMISAKYNFPDILCELLLKGAKINVKDKNGKTAKSHALDSESDDVVRILRVWYNRLWHEPRNLNYEMLAATKKGNARLVRGLILVGADMTSRYEYNASLASPRYFSGLKTLREIKEIKEKGPVLRQEDERYIGLQIAARLGHDEVIKTFLSLTPGLVKSQGHKGMTALALAVSERRYSTVMILLEHGAEVYESIVQEANREFEKSSKILDMLRLQLTSPATRPLELLRAHRDKQIQSLRA